MISRAPEPRRGRSLWPLFDLRRKRPCLVLFLLLAIPTLVATSLLVGPFQALDESSHYYRAVQLSEGRFLPVVSPQGHAAGDYLDVAVHRLGGYFLFLSYNDWWRPFGAAREDERQAWATPLAGRREFAAFSNTVIYFPLAHAAPALAIAAARAAGAPPMAWLYAGRLANAGLATLIFCLAIALFPEGRAFVFVLALLPRTVFGTAALSADALLVPCAALLAALVARLADGARLTRSQHGLVFVALLLVCVGKIAYLPLALIPPLTALLTDRRFSRQVTLLAASSLLTALVWLGWLLAIRHDVFAIRNDVPIDVYGQLAHLVRRPAHAASVLVHTLIQSGPGYIDNLVGGQLGSEQRGSPACSSPSPGWYWRSPPSWRCAGAWCRPGCRPAWRPSSEAPHWRSSSSSTCSSPDWTLRSWTGCRVATSCRCCRCWWPSCPDCGSRPRGRAGSARQSWAGCWSARPRRSTSCMAGIGPPSRRTGRPSPIRTT